MSYEEKLIDIIVSMLSNFSNFDDLPEPSKNKALLVWKRLEMFKLNELKAHVVENGELSIFETIGYETPLTFSMNGVPQYPKGTTVVIEGFCVDTDVIPINKPVSAFYTNIEVLFQEDKNAA